MCQDRIIWYCTDSPKEKCKTGKFTSYPGPSGHPGSNPGLGVFLEL